jgi:hypothetical protein
MPNHLHGIIVIDQPDNIKSKGECYSPLRMRLENMGECHSPLRMRPKSLSSFISDEE